MKQSDRTIEYEGRIYTIFVGACDLYRVRGFDLTPERKPDLQKDVYVGSWGPYSDALAELASISEKGPQSCYIRSPS